MFSIGDIVIAKDILVSTNRVSGKHSKCNYTNSWHTERVNVPVQIIGIFADDLVKARDPITGDEVFGVVYALEDLELLYSV